MSVQYQNVPQHSKPINGDYLLNLPVDETPPSPNEAHIVNSLFKEQTSTIQTILLDSKDAILVGVLIVGFSMPQIDDILHKFLPITVNSPYITLAIKGVIGAVLFWILKYMYLSQKN